MAGRTQRQSKEKLSYADYLKWPQDERFEIIDGASYAMNAPLRIHQELLVEFTRQCANHFKNKPCKVYVAPFDVRFASRSKNDDEIFNVVQPDLSIICDQSKLDEKGCLGAPDMIIEILSPATMSYDNIKKRALYEKMGVREFWLVHPSDCLVMAYGLQKTGLYGKPEVFDRESGAQSAIFPDLKIDLSEVFAPLPDGNMVREAVNAYSDKTAENSDSSRNSKDNGKKKQPARRKRR
jgi:Uma2 family endonuclease